MAPLPDTSKTVAGISKSDAFQKQVFKAIAVQRPVTIDYLRSLRREKPQATPEQILREVERRYVTTVTVTSTGVGASAAIPAVGIPLALGLGGADLLFFYEATALYALAVAELHGIEVTDEERSRPLILGMLIGKKSDSKVSKIVMHASGAGSVNQARTVATNTVGKVLPRGWGEMITQQLPDSALAPVTTVIAREALKTTAVIGAGSLGKIIPFGVGAIVGGVGSYTFGRDVVQASRQAFLSLPTEFPESLSEFQKTVQNAGSLRAARAFAPAKIAGLAAARAVGGSVTKAGKRLGSVLPKTRTNRPIHSVTPDADTDPATSTNTNAGSPEQNQTAKN